jgi:hypothetical protein
MDSSNLDVLYDDAYHAEWLEESARSAAVVVPLLLELFPRVTSVVDIGCSTGAWLHQFDLHGVSSLLGLDGAQISPRLLQIDASQFRRVDFCRPLARPGRFDLAISLEVANCLREEVAQPFVTALTGMSDVVVFSAAVPGQSPEPTLNERWPSYWCGLFAANRFSCFDILRERLWYDQRVSWCYSQNILVFVSDARKELPARLSSMHRVGPLDIVHPRVFESFRDDTRRIDAVGLMLYPYQLVEEDYRGYNILQIGVHKFLALAQSEGAYSPQKLAAGGYRFAYVAGSVREVKARIPLAISPGSAEDVFPIRLGDVFPPRLVEAGYRGFDILQIGPNEFLALAQGEGPYSPKRLAAGDYKRACVAASLEEAKRKVKTLV